MPNTKQDRSMVSSKQKWEPATVAEKFKVPVSMVREAMKTARTKKGKKTKSRKLIEARLLVLIDAMPTRL